MPAEPSRKRPRPGAPDALPGAQAAGPSDSEAGGESEAEEAEEEAELTGAGDPSFAQQHALWREGRFVDVWLQARARAPAAPAGLGARACAFPLAALPSPGPPAGRR